MNNDLEKIASIETFESGDADPMVLLINRWANMEPCIGIGMTFYVGGVIISGETISVKEWMSIQADSMFINVNEGMGAVNEALSKCFLDLKDGIYSNVNDESSKYIHLKNAFALSPDGKRISHSLSMRIKASDISGFSIARIS